MSGISRIFLSAAALLAAFVTPAFAGSINIDNPRGYYMQDDVNGTRIEIYMDIANTGDSMDRLYAVRSKDAERATLNVVEQKKAETEMNHEEGMHMRAATLVIPAGETVALTRNGKHVMLMEPNRDLADGTTITVTLFFEQAGPTKVRITLAEMEGQHTGDHKQ